MARNFRPPDQWKDPCGGQFNGLPGVARLNSNGALDPTFGNHGVATTTIDSSQIARAQWVLACNPRGKIVIGISTLFGAADDQPTEAEETDNHARAIPADP